MYIKLNGRETNIDLDGMAIGELTAIRDRLLEERQNINAQLTQAVAVRGEGNDPDWQQRAALALQYKSNQIKMLDMAIDRRTAAERAGDLRPELLAVMFMRLVADMYPGIYRQCLTDAQDRICEQLLAQLREGDK